MYRFDLIKKSTGVQKHPTLTEKKETMPMLMIMMTMNKKRMGKKQTIRPIWESVLYLPANDKRMLNRMKNQKVQNKIDRHYEAGIIRLILIVDLRKHHLYSLLVVFLLLSLFVMAVIVVAVVFVIVLSISESLSMPIHVPPLSHFGFLTLLLHIQLTFTF